jgi:hypothetical protein
MVAAGLYLWTLDNGLRPDELVGGDLITHQYAQVEGRPSNAPGYPLYTIGGWLWFRLGRILLGWALNPIQILSLYSTLWGLASLFLLYLILLRVTDRRWPIAFLLAAFYGVTFFFWYYTVTTEQYTSAVFQTLLVIWLAFSWDDRPRDGLLLWLAFISGTMLANMVTTLFILPPLLWFILFRRSESGQGIVLAGYLKRPKLVLAAAGAALLPLLSYSYIYVRGAQHPEWRGQGAWATTGEWFIQFLTIQQGRDELAPGLTGQIYITAEFPALMWQELTWLVFLGGVLGLAALGRRRAIFLYSTLLIYLLFSWAYRFGNWFQVIIPAYPVFVIGFGAGLTKIIDWAGGRRWGRFFVPLIVVLLAGLVLYRLTASLPQASQRNRPEDAGLAPGWAILADRPVTPAVIASSFEERVALQYLVTIWGAASDIRPVDAADFDPTGVARQTGWQIYLTRQAATIAPDTIQLDKVHPQARGEQLIALWPAPRQEIPPTAIPLDVEFGRQLELAGWERVESTELPPSAGLPQANWQVALYWRASTPLSEDYTISVRPLAGGQLITVAGENLIQDHQPVWGIYPTSRWRTGELVRDVYAISLPPEARPEAIQIVVYKPVGAGFENLGEITLHLDLSERQ